MNWDRAKQISLIALILTSVMVVAVVGWNVNALVLRWRKISDGVQPGLIKIVKDAERAVAPLPALVEKNAPRVSQIVLSGELATVDAQRMLNVQRQEWESPEYIRLRRDTLAFGSQATIAIARWNEKTHPVIDETAMAGRDLVRGLDRRLTADDGLIRELQTTIAALRQPVETVTPQLVALIESGRLAVDDVRSILAGDDMKRIVSEMGRASTGLADTSAEAARGTKALADTAEKFPLLAEQLNKFAATTNKYSKALILARIISILGGAFCC